MLHYRFLLRSIQMIFRAVHIVTIVSLRLVPFSMTVISCKKIKSKKNNKKKKVKRAHLTLKYIVTK